MTRSDYALSNLYYFNKERKFASVCVCVKEREIEREYDHMIKISSETIEPILKILALFEIRCAVFEHTLYIFA